MTLLSISKQQNDIAANKADLNELSIELGRREEALKRQQLDHQRQVSEWEKQHSEEKSSLEKSREEILKIGEKRDYEYRVDIQKLQFDLKEEKKRTAKLQADTAQIKASHMTEVEELTNQVERQKGIVDRLEYTVKQLQQAEVVEEPPQAPKSKENE